VRPSSATRMADDLRQRRTRLERFYREEVESFRATDRLSRDTASALKKMTPPAAPLIVDLRPAFRKPLSEVTPQFSTN